jgi:hypothetical protein
MISISNEGKTYPTNELLNDRDNASQCLDDYEPAMNRQQINKLLGETYANNALRDFRIPQPHPILERISGLAGLFFNAVTFKPADMDNFSDIADEASPLLKNVRHWSREI